jgi:hypothetical protein
MELDLVAASSQTRCRELRELSRMSFRGRKENKNEHGKPRPAFAHGGDERALSQY